MERFNYDLSHFAFQVGRVGRLTTLCYIPVLPSDSLDINIAGYMRFAPLRRDMVIDSRVDLFAFYVPYRHVYGDTWIDFMKEGVDEAQTLNTITASGLTSCYGHVVELNATMPQWMVTGYNRIWNRYFRHPTDTTNELTDTEQGADANERQYGQKVCHLPHNWSTGVDPQTDASDRQVSTAGDLLDILDLERIKYRYKTETEREWFGNRYNELMDRIFSSNINVDADERPELIYRKNFWSSGYDVDGTADANLGAYSGKAYAKLDMTIPRKFIPEHGTIWIMACVRFPTIHDRESHYLYNHPNPTYAEISGDPSVIGNEPPKEMQIGDYINGSATQTLGKQPYAQWYRTQPNFQHLQYADVDAFPFYEGNIWDYNRTRYVDSEFFDEIFQTTQLDHFRMNCRVSVDAMRIVPPGGASIYAATK